MKTLFNKLMFGSCLILSLSILAGCGGKKDAVPTPTPTPIDYEHIDFQMDDVSTTSARNLEDNTFYVEHTNEDGTKVYYKLGRPFLEDNNYYYLSNTEDIPTLFLGQDDKLVFHSYQSLLHNIFFSRVKDLGYTIGIYDISSMENGRCYLGTGEEHVLSICTDAGFLNEQEADDILVAEMGQLLPTGYTLGTTPTEGTKTAIYDKNTNILSYYDGLELTTTRDLEEYNLSFFNPEAPDLNTIRYKEVWADEIDRGILYGLKQDETYHLEFYSGTYYDTSNMKANIHIYSPTEYFHTNYYRLRQSTLFEIDFPKQMENGIYSVSTNLNNFRYFFRYIKEADYSINDSFDDYIFPEGLSGVYSNVEKYNKIFPNEDLVDETATLDLSRIAHPWYLLFTEEVNSMTWVYRENDVQYGNILNSHKDLLAQTDAPFVTIRENVDGSLILNHFYKDLPEGKEFSPIEGVTQYIYTGTDIVFYRNNAIIFEPTEGLTGLLALNAEFELKITPAMPQIEVPTVIPTPTEIPTLPGTSDETTEFPPEETWTPEEPDVPEEIPVEETQNSTTQEGVER